MVLNILSQTESPPGHVIEEIAWYAHAVPAQSSGEPQAFPTQGLEVVLQSRSQKTCHRTRTGANSLKIQGLQGCRGFVGSRKGVQESRIHLGVRVYDDDRIILFGNPLEGPAQGVTLGPALRRCALQHREAVPARYLRCGVRAIVGYDEHPVAFRGIIQFVQTLQCVRYRVLFVMRRYDYGKPRPSGGRLQNPLPEHKGGCGEHREIAPSSTRQQPKSELHQDRKS